VVTQLSWFGLLTTQYLHDVNTAEFKPLPREIEMWVDARVRPDMKYRSLAAVNIQFGATKLVLERIVLLNVSSLYADIMLFSSAPPLPFDLFTRSWDMINQQAMFERDGREVTLHELWSEAISEIIPKSSEIHYEGASFGPVAIVERRKNQIEDELEDEVDTSNSLKTHGVHRNDTVYVGRNSLIVLTDDNQGVLTGSAWGYVLLAGVFSRNRLISNQIIRRASEVSREITRHGLRRPAEHILMRSAEIQQFGIESRAWTQGASYLGNPHLVGIFNKAGGLATLGEVERENQLAALEGLDRFTAGLSGAVSARSQRRLNTVGFVVAILSLLLTGINVTYFANARWRPRVWVFETWTLTLLTVSAALGLTLWFSKRAKVWRD
jgi:hypothetical protein